MDYQLLLNGKDLSQVQSIYKNWYNRAIKLRGDLSDPKAFRLYKAMMRRVLNLHSMAVSLYLQN